jgi:hypothetical protein
MKGIKYLKTMIQCLGAGAARSQSFSAMRLRLRRLRPRPWNSTWTVGIEPPGSEPHTVRKMSLKNKHFNNQSLMWREFNPLGLNFQCWRIFCAVIQSLTIEYLFFSALSFPRSQSRMKILLLSYTPIFIMLRDCLCLELPKRLILLWIDIYCTRELCKWTWINTWVANF